MGAFGVLLDGVVAVAEEARASADILRLEGSTRRVGCPRRRQLVAGLAKQDRFGVCTLRLQQHRRRRRVVLPVDDVAHRSEVVMATQLLVATQQSHFLLFAFGNNLLRLLTAAYRRCRSSDLLEGSTGGRG